MASILLFRTDIQQASKELQSMLNNHQSIQRWSIDIEDVDRVLKIVSNELQSHQVIEFVESLGHSCIEF